MNRDQARASHQPNVHVRRSTRPGSATSPSTCSIAFDESKAQAWNSQYIKDAFKGHVHRYERLGTYTSPDNEKLDVLIVHLTKESKLERARTAIRNFVADHLKTRDEKDAALVAFVSPTEHQWRFSYVKMEYATVEKDPARSASRRGSRPPGASPTSSAKAKAATPRRPAFSTCFRTPTATPTLADIEEAFSVEAVTKEFFTKYAELFGDIHKALEKLVDEGQGHRAKNSRRRT